MALQCKRCGGRKHVKNGWMRDRQRYRCKTCGMNFTDTMPRGKPREIRMAAAMLYIHGLPMSLVARILGVSAPSVHTWVKELRHILDDLREELIP